MSIIANNIQYSNGNIQTCSLVIDSKAFQIQYQDGSYKVSSSGEATSQSNDPVSSSGTGITNTLASSGINTSLNTSGTISNTSGTLSNTSAAAATATGAAGAGLSEESSIAEKKTKKRINTKKLNILMNKQ